MLLKLTFKRISRKCTFDLPILAYAAVSDFCEHGNEVFDFVQGTGFPY
jgi:hypothetical protein